MSPSRPTVHRDCGGSLTTTAPAAISFIGGTLAAAANCTFSVATTGATTGTKLNTTSAISSTEGGAGNSAQATLLVNDPFVEIDLNKQVSADNVNWFKFVGVPVGDAVSYRFSIYNGGQVPFTAVSVVDPTLAGGPLDPVTCSFATPLAPGATTSCVTGPVASVLGLHPNTATVSGTYASGTALSEPSIATYATPGLSIVKSAAESNFVAAGDVLHYSYLVTNSGFTPLLGPVTVADDKSADETCPAVATVGDLDNYLDAGESITCTATYTVQPGDVSGVSVTNTAHATADGVTSPDDSVTVPLQSSSITVVKTALPTVVSAVGDNIAYSFLVTNTGSVTLTSVGVSDPLVGLSVISCPGTVLAPAASMTCTASYSVTQANLNVGSISNTATASGAPPAGPPVTDTDSVTVTVTQSSSITVVKTALPTVVSAVGDNIAYSFLVTNTGSVTLTSVGVSDPLVGLSVISCPGTVLAPAASMTCTALYSVTQANLNFGSISNTATVSGAPPAGPPVTDTDSVTVTATQSSSITVVKTALPTVVSAVGDNIAYSFLVTNTGSVTLTSVGVSDPLVGLSVISCPGTVLAPAASMTCTASYSVTQANLNFGSISNTATVSGAPPAGPPVTDTDSVTVTATTTPQLSVVKSTSSTSYNAVGQVLDFTLTITNTGDVTLSNVFVSDASAAVGVCTPTLPTTMAPGDVSVCSAAHAVTQSDIDHGSYDNVAMASGTPPGGQPFTVGSNAVTVPAIQNAAVVVVKATNVSRFSSVGQQIAYTITATNVGNVTITGVTIIDPNVEMGLCAPIAPTTLAPGGSVTCAAVHTVTQADLDAGRIVNTARVEGDAGLIPLIRASNTITVVRTIPVLPVTGGDSSLLLTWANWFAAAGGVALLASMRRRRVRSNSSH